MEHFYEGWSGLPHVLAEFKGKAAVVVTDDTVAKLHLDYVAAELETIFSRVFVAKAEGEETKSFAALETLLNAFSANDLRRDDVVISLGGGGISDLAGLAASLYMRGIAHVVLPTTLLAMADSSMGGKTAIDFAGRKNLVGTYHAPAAIYANLAALETLADVEYISGLAEMIKYGIIHSRPLFDDIWRLREKIAARSLAVLKPLLVECARIKFHFAQEAGKDSGPRLLLNYGHTFGHAIETVCGFKIPHGHAVGLGMVCAAAFSRNMGGMAAEDVERIKKMLQYFGLPTLFPGKYGGPRDILQKMWDDKKVADGGLVLIIADDIGGAYVMKNADEAAALLAIHEIF